MKIWCFNTVRTSWLVLCTAIVLVDAAAQELPPGVPNPIGPDGKYTSAVFFTTRAYQAEAFRLVLQEANQVAKELELPEKLPITVSNTVYAFITPFGDAYANKRLGNITTRHYSYGVEQGYKFSELCIMDLDKLCFGYRESYQLPREEFDTNSAYCLATQWLAAVHVDVEALNRECQVEVEVNPFWNRIKRGGKLRETFVPIYDVHWLSPKNIAEKVGDIVMVEMFTPTKTLLQLSVQDPKYVLRPSLVVTNLAYLLSQTNPPPATSQQPR